jgi:hypothetical protein
MPCFIRSQTLVLAIVAFVAPITVSHAGSCTAQIDVVQAQVDARAAALLHRQPSPGSIARAEESLGEGATITKALSALERAREADRGGSEGSCEQALAEARRAIGP